MGKFDAKSFNEKNFKYSVEHPRVPNLKTSEMKKSKILKGSQDIKDTFGASESTYYSRIASKGLLDGQAVNYDGQTDITATNTKTYERGVIVIGRAKAWTEKDFSEDISGQDFMQNIADQVAEYKDGLDQDTILSILKGIFSMSTGAKNKEFVEKHTTTVKGNMDSTTLNSATNKACGKNKKKFGMVFMDSDVQTNLENMNLLKNLVYTDKDGVSRDISLYSWGGKLVIVDDMPKTEGYMDATADTEGSLKIVANTATPAAGEIKLEEVTPYLDDRTLKAGDYVVFGTEYTTYALGEGSIDYEDLPMKHPYGASRDEAKNGGEDTLYMRQRKVFAPVGISYENTTHASLSPTDAELENGNNWALVNSGETSETDRSYIDHRAIAICRIISRG